MNHFEQIINIKDVPGVKEFLFIDNKGRIIVHDIKEPEELASIISTSVIKLFAIAKKIQYLTLSRACKNDLYIFPVGKHTLAVVKHSNVKNAEFSGRVVEFLNHKI